MMTLINAIPEHIGWMSVGFFGCLCLEMVRRLIGTVVNMIRERMTDDETEEC